MVILQKEKYSTSCILFAGTIIMACNTDITNYRPMLWCISPDEYAFSYNFSERYFITDLDVCPLTLDNIGPNLLVYNDPSLPQPPLIVRQQFENRQEYITLAPQVSNFKKDLYSLIHYLFSYNRVWKYLKCFDLMTLSVNY